MFSGLRSQWIILKWQKNSKVCRIWIENLLIRSRLKPAKLVYFRNSYRFLWRISKVMHAWPLKLKEFFILTRLQRSLGSCKSAVYNISTYILAWLVNFCWALIIFNATNYFFLWSYALYTFPNDPLPRFSVISYLYAIASPILTFGSPYWSVKSLLL